MNPKILLLIPILLSMSTLAIAVNSSSSLYVMYQQYSSTLQTTPSHITYKYSSTAYNTTISSTSNERTITYMSYSFDVNIGPLSNYTGQISVNVDPFSISVTSQIPQLARVLLVEPGLVEELVWAGFTNTSSTVRGLAYFNNTATLVLQFLNGSSLANVTFNISHSQSNYQKTITLLLHKVNLTMTGELQLTLTIQGTQPQRYSKMEFNYEGVSAEAPYTTSIAYYNGTYVPAMIWSREVSGLLSTELTNLQGNVYFTDIEFFGVNGTVIGSVDNSFSSIYFSHQGLILNVTYNSVSSRIKMVVNPNAEYSKPSVATTVSIGGNPAVVVVTNRGVESTGNINLYHQVVVNTPATLVYVNTTTSGGYVVIFSNGSYKYVSQVNPSVTVSNISLGGKTYTGQVVNISSSSNYVIFNVSAVKNETFAVFKQTSNGMVELNPNNYFIYNGKIVVFDDPLTTYYIVYGYQPSSPSIGISNNLLLVIIVVVVIVAIVALVLGLRRR
ncbi:hypothetical protein [Sulfolobus sp. E11-6]|uniref:hypothetical protein n=1 Tax=Sulfolobus sp. E11-6 TaxID=2663020 RepID=UPI0012980A03|nr:hypothetical protein [Sulfolobus sp. E11-6]QGA69051.1 hypothetical protein GFS33_10340 [Sulfolobus sp. E11-6]